MMNKRLMKFLQKHEVSLNQYFVVYPTYKTFKYAKYMYGLFGVIFFVYLLDLFTALDLGINGLFIYLALTFLVLYPLATRTDNPHEVLIVESKGLIFKKNKTELITIKYNDISNFKKDDLAIYVLCKREIITLSFELYESIIPKIIDILEAYGKTFDESKDYMIRPIELVMDETGIHIIEVKAEETETERITKKLFDQYEHLTPGFIDDIIPRNALITGVVLDKKHLQLQLSHLTVKDGHPENVSFDNIEALDCILVFEEAGIMELSERHGMERQTPYDDVEVNISNLKRLLIDSVIDEWKYNKSDILFILKSGIGNARIRVGYKEVIVGWKKEK